MLKENAQPVTEYSQRELFEMWTHFRDAPNADKILSDFMAGGKAEARALIAEFEIQYESHSLGVENRGKPC